jgi:dolichol-phosphate mannosyltransferase
MNWFNPLLCQNIFPLPAEYPLFTYEEFKEKRNRYCICIFVLNEKKHLPLQLEKMKPTSKEWDVIVADGGSTDGCNQSEMIRSFNVRALLIKQDKDQAGLGSQMRMAFAYAISCGYEGIITVDGNDKDDVTAGVPYFVEKLDQGYDHIQGSRFIAGGAHKNTPFSRLVGVRCIHSPFISLVSLCKYTDTTNGFRAYSRKFLLDPQLSVFRKSLSGYELHYFLAIEAGRKKKFRTTEVPVRRIYPEDGTVPTKIHGILGNLRVLKKMLLAGIGYYKP